MRALVIGILVLLASCSSNDRPVEELPSYRIDELCQANCSRIIECAYPDHTGTVSFSDEASCFEACVSDVVWERTCADEKEDLLDCKQELECPDYLLHYTAPRDERPCGVEQAAYSACLPGDRR